MRFALTLSEAESEALREMIPAGASPQDFLRAVLYALQTGGSASLEEARRLAKQGAQIPSAHVPGQQRGYTVEDYRRAIEEGGSLSGAARYLGVHRKTVREMVDLYDLDVPTLRRS